MIDHCFKASSKKKKKNQFPFINCKKILPKFEYSNFGLLQAQSNDELFYYLSSFFTLSFMLCSLPLPKQLDRNAHSFRIDVLLLERFHKIQGISELLNEYCWKMSIAKIKSTVDLV